MDNERKVKASKKSGSGTDDIYVPSYEHFAEMSFLQDNDQPRDGISTINNLEDNINITTPKPRQNQLPARDFSSKKEYFDLAIKTLQQPIKIPEISETDGMLAILKVRLDNMEIGSPVKFRKFFAMVNVCDDEAL